MILYLYTRIQQLLQICGVPGPATARDLVIQITGTARGLVILNVAIVRSQFYKGLQFLQVYFTRGCNCYWDISQGIALPVGPFHRVLQLPLGYFTGYCNSYRTILQGIAIATGVFHQGLQFLLGYFTGYCNCYRSISPGVAIAAGIFHRVLQFLQVYFTEHCNCHRYISPGVAIATGIFHRILQFLQGITVAFHCPLTAFGGWWETHPFMDNLAYLLPPDLVAWWLCTTHLLPIGPTVSYHRAPLLHFCCMRCLGYISEGGHEYLDAFWTTNSHSI